MKWRQIGREAHAIFLSLMDRETPGLSKFLVAGDFFLVLAYIVSTIDLAPDVIPVLGWGDDFAVALLGVLLAGKFIPKHILSRNRERAGIRASKSVQIPDEHTGQ